MFRDNSAEDRSILVTAFGGKVFGLERRSGQVMWSAELEAHGGEVDLVIDAGVVVACSRNRLALIEYKTGRPIAYVALVGEYARRPTMIVDQGQIIIARNGEIACYGYNGQAIWHQPFEGKGFGSMAVGLPGNVRQADDAGTK